VHLLLRNQVQQHLLSLQQPGVPVLLHLPVPGVLLLLLCQYHHQQMLLLPVPTQAEAELLHHQLCLQTLDKILLMRHLLNEGVELLCKAAEQQEEGKANMEEDEATLL
jgi:hypothetical protein